jgi:tetratricopeptide (TPR) repeat protein
MDELLQQMSKLDISKTPVNENMLSEIIGMMKRQSMTSMTIGELVENLHSIKISSSNGNNNDKPIIKEAFKIFPNNNNVGQLEDDDSSSISSNDDDDDDDDDSISSNEEDFKIQVDSEDNDSDIEDIPTPNSVLDSSLSSCATSPNSSFTNNSLSSPSFTFKTPLKETFKLGTKSNKNNSKSNKKNIKSNMKTNSNNINNTFIFNKQDDNNGTKGPFSIDMNNISPLPKDFKISPIIYNSEISNIDNDCIRIRGDSPPDSPIRQVFSNILSSSNSSIPLFAKPNDETNNIDIENIENFSIGKLNNTAIRKGAKQRRGQTPKKPTNKNIQDNSQHINFSMPPPPPPPTFVSSANPSNATANATFNGGLFWGSHKETLSESTNQQPENPSLFNENKSNSSYSINVPPGPPLNFGNVLPAKDKTNDAFSSTSAAPPIPPLSAPLNNLNSSNSSPKNSSNVDDDGVNSFYASVFGNNVAPGSPSTMNIEEEDHTDSRFYDFEPPPALTPNPRNAKNEEINSSKPAEGINFTSEIPLFNLGRKDSDNSKKTSPWKKKDIRKSKKNSSVEKNKSSSSKLNSSDKPPTWWNSDVNLEDDDKNSDDDEEYDIADIDKDEDFTNDIFKDTVNSSNSLFGNAPDLPPPPATKTNSSAKSKQPIDIKPPPIPPPVENDAHLTALAELYRKQGKDSYNEEKFDRALYSYDKCLEVAPKSCTFRTIVLGNRAATYMMLDRYIEAVEDCETAVREDPSMIKLHVRKGRAFLRLGHFSSAIDAFTRVLESSLPNSSSNEDGKIEARAALKIVITAEGLVTKFNIQESKGN